MSIIPYGNSGVEVKYLSFSEVNEFLEVVKEKNHRDYVFFLFLYSMGSRPKETCRNTFKIWLWKKIPEKKPVKVEEKEITTGLRKRDINFLENKVRIVTLKKRWRINEKLPYRTLVIPQNLLVHLSLLVNELNLGPDDFIFQFNRKYADKLFKEYAEFTSLPEDRRSCKVLRHSNAIHSVNKRIPITILQKRFGHSSLNTTAKYLQYDEITEEQHYKEFGN